MIQRCGACTGETRVACDEAFTEFRRLAGTTSVQMFRKEAETDLIGVLAAQQRMTVIGEETGQVLKVLGCKLEGVPLMETIGSEIDEGTMMAYRGEFGPIDSEPAEG